jgi:uncharacterized protein involved in response to NO
MATVLLHLQEPHTGASRRWALWDLGFRPFYLLAALQAALSIPLWALQFSGWVGTPVFRGAVWHAHEMVFGFALAVIIGFLFTAGRNWSGQPTPTGRPLMALAALWVLARVLVLTPWTWASLVVNACVPWLAAWGLWRALQAGGNRRNHFFVGLLALLGVGSVGVHLGQAGWVTWPQGAGLGPALDVVLFIIAVMAGRVVPMFSNNGVPGLKARRVSWVEKGSLGSLIAIVLADSTGLVGWPMATVLLVALSLHTYRWWLWQPWGTLRVPLVWVLHGASFWLLVHLALRALATMHWIPAGPATHALTVGLMGMVILGMITRTALGHTGRRLQAGPVEVTAYLAVALAAAVRVLMPLLAPASLPSSTLVAAVLWSMAFALYLWRYTPWLMRARADGQPG